MKKTPAPKGLDDLVHLHHRLEHMQLLQERSKNEEGRSRLTAGGEGGGRNRPLPKNRSKSPYTSKAHPAVRLPDIVSRPSSIASKAGTSNGFGNHSRPHYKSPLRQIKETPLPRVANLKKHPNGHPSTSTPSGSSSALPDRPTTAKSIERLRKQLGTEAPQGPLSRSKSEIEGRPRVVVLEDPAPSTSKDKRTLRGQREAALEANMDRLQRENQKLKSMAVDPDRRKEFENWSREELLKLVVELESTEIRKPMRDALRKINSLAEGAELSEQLHHAQEAIRVMSAGLKDKHLQEERFEQTKSQLEEKFHQARGVIDVLSRENEELKEMLSRSATQQSIASKSTTPHEMPEIREEPAMEVLPPEVASPPRPSSQRRSSRRPANVPRLNMHHSSGSFDNFTPNRSTDDSRQLSSFDDATPRAPEGYLHGVGDNDVSADVRADGNRMYAEYQKTYVNGKEDYKKDEVPDEFFDTTKMTRYDYDQIAMDVVQATRSHIIRKRAIEHWKNEWEKHKK